jgi:hypothetical protein
MPQKFITVKCEMGIEKGFEFPKVFNFGGGAIWLARRAGQAGDPSLRLKNGCAQDDAGGRSARCFFKLTHHRTVRIVVWMEERW